MLLLLAARSLSVGHRGAFLDILNIACMRLTSSCLQAAAGIIGISVLSRIASFQIGPDYESGCEPKSHVL
jgi:hypothetical protein